MKITEFSRKNLITKNPKQQIFKQIRRDLVDENLTYSLYGLIVYHTCNRVIKWKI